MSIHLLTYNGPNIIIQIDLLSRAVDETTKRPLVINDTKQSLSNGYALSSLHNTWKHTGNLLLQIHLNQEERGRRTGLNYDVTNSENEVFGVMCAAIQPAVTSLYPDYLVSKIFVKKLANSATQSIRIYVAPKTRIWGMDSTTVLSGITEDEENRKWNIPLIVSQMPTANGKHDANNQNYLHPMKPVKLAKCQAVIEAAKYNTPIRKTGTNITLNKDAPEFFPSISGHGTK